MRKPKSRGAWAWWDSFDTGMAVWTTLAHRLPMIAADGMANREGLRMVSEKVEATMEGAFDATLAAWRFAGQAMLAPMTPERLARGGLAIADAATKPARRKVRANARRLSKPEPRG